MTDTLVASGMGQVPLSGDRIAIKKRRNKLFDIDNMNVVYFD